MNSFLIMAVSTVIVTSSSGKTIETRPEIAHRCAAAVTQQVGQPPASDSPTVRDALGDAVVECIRIQNNFAKKK